ncbi:beta-1,4-galactosyltransferase 2-like isoform X2 [Lampetra planeri]
MSLSKPLETVCVSLVILCSVHFFVVLVVYSEVPAKAISFLRQRNLTDRLDADAVWPPPPMRKTHRADLASATLGVQENVDVSGQSPPREPTEPCSDDPAGLVGPLLVEFNIPVTLEETKTMNPKVQEGGRFRPANCVSKQKVAIIIPFRHRDEHLKYWLYYLHPILQRQTIEYGIYVINQFGEGVFNRAKLMNIGYVEALKDAPYDCFIFSDVDLVPMDDRNLYRCYDNPRHFSVAMDKFGFHLPYNSYFGGVSGLSKAQFEKINGFPNNYWGWGGEDDDIYTRVSLAGMHISRPSGEIGRYRMIKHTNDKNNEPNPQRRVGPASAQRVVQLDSVNQQHDVERRHQLTSVLAGGKKTRPTLYERHSERRQPLGVETQCVHLSRFDSGMTWV